MNILQLTPGAGAMFCGNCLRDNALVGALRRMGHEVLMVPLYLPLTLDEPDQSAGTRIFFGGISVFLAQQSALFRVAPGWFRNLLASRRLLEWAAGQAARTRAADLGELTLSILRGESGNQARELEELITWLKTQPRPDVIYLSNAMLLGLARRLRTELRAPLVCMLQGEDSFLNALPNSHRALCWQALAQRTADADHFVAPSHYFADLMQQRLGLSADRVSVVYNGINLDGYGPEDRGTGKAESGNGETERQRADGSPRVAAGGTPAATVEGKPVLGYFARMCPEKGLDMLVDAYLILRQRGRVPDLKLRVGGSCGPADEPVVQAARQKLGAAGVLGEVEFHPNLVRAAKVAFLKSLSVFSAPARYGEAFGLYVIEALAVGVPVVQPRSGAFPELVEATGGGVLCEAGDPAALAEKIEELLLDPGRARALGDTGRRTVFEKFGAEAMARGMLGVVEALRRA